MSLCRNSIPFYEIHAAMSKKDIESDMYTETPLSENIYIIYERIIRYVTKFTYGCRRIIVGKRTAFIE